MTSVQKIHKIKQDLSKGTYHETQIMGARLCLALEAMCAKEGLKLRKKDGFTPEGLILIDYITHEYGKIGEHAHIYALTNNQEEKQIIKSLAKGAK
jgi:hypothetical protein